jgi:glycosyltransferase involved in cell wall biosynthesis
MPDHYQPPPIAAYLRRRAVAVPWHIAGQPAGAFRGAVVIPSLAESRNLPQTLLSLAANPAEFLSRFLLLVVVNQRCDASPGERADNLATLDLLPSWKREYGLEHLHWVDAATTGNELPPKQGVGLARKIGLDLALGHLDFAVDDPLLVCLDADTLVQPDYLAALEGHFVCAAEGGASIPYRHRPAGDLAGQTAIDRYELFLRAYVLGLEQAASPYAFHTVGSAMACRASAYAASGGMNRRLAGEDFYFLQQVHKVAGVAQLAGTIVHPSPRPSHRVPFGTGRAVGEMLALGDGRLLFYQPMLFRILGEWLACVGGHDRADGARLLRRADEISPHLRGFLEQAGFSAAWDNLLRHNPDENRLMTAFHGWFDAFRTMRLLHHLSDSAWPRVPPEQAVAPLLEWAARDGAADAGGLLERLRVLQGV